MRLNCGWLLCVVLSWWNVSNKPGLAIGCLRNGSVYDSNSYPGWISLVNLWCWQSYRRTSWRTDPLREMRRRIYKWFALFTMLFSFCKMDDYTVTNTATMRTIHKYIFMQNRSESERFLYHLVCFHEYNVLSKKVRWMASRMIGKNGLMNQLTVSFLKCKAIELVT